MMGSRRTEVFDAVADAYNAREEPWRLLAGCRDRDLTPVFFEVFSQQRAKNICADCTVQRECETYWRSLPLALQDHGVWFGMTEEDRKRMKRRQRTLARHQRLANEALDRQLPPVLHYSPPTTPKEPSSE